MIDLTLAEVARVVGGRLHRADPAATVGGRRVADLRDALPARERAGVRPRPDVVLAP